jgi:hypothetical protein
MSLCKQCNSESEQRQASAGEHSCLKRCKGSLRRYRSLVLQELECVPPPVVQGAVSDANDPNALGSNPQPSDPIPAPRSPRGRMSAAESTGTRARWGTPDNTNGTCHSAQIPATATIDFRGPIRCSSRGRNHARQPISSKKASNDTITNPVTAFRMMRKRSSAEDNFRPFLAVRGRLVGKNSRI